VALRELSPSTFGDICEERARECGVEKFSPHDLRRTYASELLDAGVELHVASEMLGHAELATTARYDIGVAKRRRAAIARLPMPLAGGR
jgi:site-specific recombinase XerD